MSKLHNCTVKKIFLDRFLEVVLLGVNDHVTIRVFNALYNTFDIPWFQQRNFEPILISLSPFSPPSHSL